jgi:glucarate dehydratase
MKISAIRATPVNIPYRQAAVMSAGFSDQSTRTIIEIETDVGLTGLGEASYAWAAPIIEREFAPAIVGLELQDVALLRRYCLPDHLDFGTPLLKVLLAAWGGVDIALWDLLAKAAERPLYEYLGGAARERAPFGAYSYSAPDPSTAPSTLAAIARQGLATTGASLFEFKVGIHPIEVDVATILAVHDAVKGTARVSVDANMAWSLADARAVLRATAPVLENLEEPVESLREMQALASEFDVNISAHCSDLDAIVPHARIGVVPTLDACGGITGVRRLAQTLGPLGRRMWLRSHAEAGIGWAAIVHLGMSTPELERPAQSLIDLLTDDLVMGERWDVRNGGVRAPDLPGLGVILDRAAVQAAHELYLQHGQTLAFPPALTRSDTPGR